MTELYRIGENIFRVKHWAHRELRESLLTKYKVIDVNPDGAELISSSEDNTVTLENGYSLKFDLAADELGGFDIRLPITEEDRLFGLGDESRTCLEKHGKIAQIRQENVRSYGPMPFLMSSRGWAVLVNCTFAHTFDIGATNPNLLHIHSDNGALDFIVFLGNDLKDALYLSGKVMGRPVMLPKTAYGLSICHNEDATARSVLDDVLRFKERKIPCDFFSLEPSWMTKHYDDSTKKTWNKDRYYIPSWMPENYYGSLSFIWNMNQMGASLSLWLNCGYDIFWKEEGNLLTAQAKEADEEKDYSDSAINDPRLKKGIRLDKKTVIGEDWFEHLKKFVDNGAEAFKVDCHSQGLPYPDRVWAGRYFDDEIRLLYPAVLMKQMKEGFEEHTGRRAMIWNPCSYPGIQKYCAIWAGDTGCTPEVLLSMMNFAMCGHSNTSSDMTCEAKDQMHLGFLSPWTEHQAWDSWLYPWYCGEELENAYRFYSQLRYQLFPYIYSYAHVANETSYPMVRPFPLAYEKAKAGKYEHVYHEYMFGDAFLVAAFNNEIELPEEDEWFDYWTGKKVTGDKKFTFTPNEVQGGGLYVRAGSIVVTQDWALSLRNYRPDHLYVHVYPGKDASFTLYEDDYMTYSYEKGEIAKTEMTLKNNVLTIAPRTGSYPDMPEEVSYTVIWHNEDGSTKEIPVGKNDGKAIEVKGE